MVDNCYNAIKHATASKSPHSRSQRRRHATYKDATGLVAQRPGDEGLKYLMPPLKYLLHY